MNYPEFPYVWVWRSRLPDRKGQRCRMLIRGAMNSCLLEFEDGFLVVTSRNGIRKARFAWNLDGVKPLSEPQPARGSPGLWEWNL